MTTPDRKLNLRIARRKKKIQRLIEQQQKQLDTFRAEDYPDQQDYWQALNQERGKLHRLEHELKILESGRLPGWNS